MFEYIKAASDTVLDMINVVSYDKPLIFTGASFREQLVSHHRAVDEVLLLTYAESRIEALALTTETFTDIILHDWQGKIIVSIFNIIVPIQFNLEGPHLMIGFDHCQMKM